MTNIWARWCTQNSDANSLQVLGNEANLAIVTSDTPNPWGNTTGKRIILQSQTLHGCQTVYLLFLCMMWHFPTTVTKTYKTECYTSCTLHKHMSNHKYLYGNDYHRCVTWFRLVIQWEEANLNTVHHVCVISSEQAGYKLATLGLTRYLTYKTLRISYTIVDIISSNLQY